jgi:hypothetical protein
MSAWQVVLDAAGAVLLLVLLYGIALVVRRRVLARAGGTFELSYRARSDKAGRGWVLGLGRYAGENLEWFKIFSLSPRPKALWDRADVEYAGQRLPTRVEALSLYADHVVVSCNTLEGVLELAMTPASLTGFQSWLEAMPPGTRGVRPGDAPGSV